MVEGDDGQDISTVTQTQASADNADGTPSWMNFQMFCAGCTESSNDQSNGFVPSNDVVGTHASQDNQTSDHPIVKKAFVKNVRIVSPGHW